MKHFLITICINRWCQLEDTGIFSAVASILQIWPTKFHLKVMSKKRGLQIDQTFYLALSEFLNNYFFLNELTDKLVSNDFSVSLSKSLMSLGISFSSVIEPANVSCHIWWVLFRISRFLCLSEARKNGLRSSSKERSNFPSYLKMNKINCQNSNSQFGHEFLLFSSLKLCYYNCFRLHRKT